MKCFIGCIAGFISGILFSGMIGAAFALVFQASYTNVMQSIPMGIITFLMIVFSTVVGGDIGNDHDKVGATRQARLASSR